MRTPEHRTYADEQLELRGKAGAGAVLIGYPIVYNVRSTLIGGWFYEEVLRGAPDESIVSDAVKFTYNHEAMLARSVPEREHFTLRLSTDDHGERAEAELPDTDIARRVWAMVDRGDITGMSFAFRTLGEDETWWSETEDGVPLRSIKRIRQFDAAVVDDPAYSDTEVWAEGALRSLSQTLNKPLAELRAAIDRHEFRSIWTPGESAQRVPGVSAEGPSSDACPSRSAMAARVRLLGLGLSADSICPREKEPQE